MKNCSNLILLSGIACQLAECLSAEALLVLSADLVVLGDMLANLSTRKDVCDTPAKSSKTISCNLLPDEDIICSSDDE